MALSSFDMYMAGGSGKCVQIFHVIGDNLCQLGKPPPRPNLGPVEDNLDDTDDKFDLEEFNQLEIENSTQCIPEVQKISLFNNKMLEHKLVNRKQKLKT